MVGNGDLVGFWQNLGRGHLEKFRAQAENRKTQFAGARDPKAEGIKVTTLSRMVVRNFLTVYVLTDQTPTGGKTRNTRISGHFGLGRPSALREIRGDPTESQFPAARRPEMKNKKLPRYPGWLSAAF